MILFTLTGAFEYMYYTGALWDYSTIFFKIKNRLVMLFRKRAEEF